ncbi:Site-specific DNA recombinase [Clostridium cavendishii DSM 21758]|uniref:Site-specific DNA recombinase n=1 Tax=Clostridium cavendishii DSM 21758 TaxID=1121302 RepID=A0A1M6LR46_9CLOT|nr:recombinase family protein [Clostridium cavendishii]SHJ73646.1 Site-specific DNA recombinase [Clostridium cavendishii DSM 21758]
MKKIWNIAIYARVSTDKKEQSESIPAQVDSLKKWVLDKSKTDVESIYNLVEIYEDQGFSGSNFERASFIKMKDAIEAGKINMVVTRDLSRFSRNYVMAGYYLEDYFKVNGIRFISVLDNVDTNNEFDDIIPFKNILNEMYVKDCSRRIKDALKQRMLRGSSIASKPPYGYKFDTLYEGNVKTIKLIPADDITTEVVKDIFKYYLSGWGAGKIATELNKRGIEPPSARIKNFAKSKFGLWNANTILSILKNPKYGGYMVQQRFKKVSYKIKKVKTTDKDQWVLGGEFEGIIDKNTFNEVQRLIKVRAKKNRHKGELHLFSTVLQCGDCGGSMCYRKSYEGYKCSNSQRGGGRCTAHSVKEEYLKSILKEELKRLVEEKIDKDKLCDDINKELSKENNDDKELKNIEKELKKLDKKISIIYEDKLNGVINERNFKGIIADIESKQKKLEIRKEQIISRINDTRKQEEIFESYRGYIDKILEFDDFDRETVEKIAKKIVVLKKDGKNKLEIFLNFNN